MRTSKSPQQHKTQQNTHKDLNSSVSVKPDSIHFSVILISSWFSCSTHICMQVTLLSSASSRPSEQLLFKKKIWIKSDWTCLTAVILTVHRDTPEQVRKGRALLFLYLLLLKQKTDTPTRLTTTVCVCVCVFRSQVKEIRCSCFHCGAFRVQLGRNWTEIFCVVLCSIWSPSAQVSFH